MMDRDDSGRVGGEGGSLGDNPDSADAGSEERAQRRMVRVSCTAVTNHARLGLLQGCLAGLEVIHAMVLRLELFAGVTAQVVWCEYI